MPGPLAALLPALGTVVRSLPFVGQGISGLKNSLPHLEDEVIVEVVGQPGSKRRDLYFLALSAACSVVRRFDIAQKVAPPPGMLLLEYGIGTGAEDHSVRVTLRFRTSLLSSAIAGRVDSAPGFAANAIVGGPLGTLVVAQTAAYLAAAARPLPMYAEAAIFSGPKDEVVGAPFTFTGYLVPGLPNSATAVGAPQLPFANRTIVTKADTCPDPDPTLPAGAAAVIPTPNPKPSGDNRSRGSVPVTDTMTGVVQQLLVPMIHAVISNPGSPFMQTFPAPTPGPTGG